MKKKQKDVKFDESKVQILNTLPGGIALAMVSVDDVDGQELNARFMQEGMFNQLVENIKSRGGLEQLPYCAVREGGKDIEIVSGHHRIMASREAGHEMVPILLDTKHLTPSQIAAKQVAHNAIQGEDDQDILAKIIESIDNPDDLLATFIGDDFMPDLGGDTDELIIPEVNIEWKTITFTFLPDQLEDFKELIEETMGNSPNLVGAVPADQWDKFNTAVSNYQEFANVKNAGIAVSLMAEIAMESIREFDESYEPDPTKWMPISTLFQSGKIPRDAAETIKMALRLMEESGDISKGGLWRALELWAADYIAGCPAAVD